MKHGWLRQMLRGGLLSLFLCALLLASCQAAEKNVFYVYDEIKNPQYVWYPSGWMPDGGGISFTDSFTENCHSGNNCMKIGFDARKKDWVGIYWLPEPGKWKGPGINVYNQLKVKEKPPVKLTFWAKGDKGGERVQFKVGGVADGKDSIAFPVELDYLTLEKDWKQYDIDLSKEDLSNVVGGFCWATNKEQNFGQNVIWFYLDDIRYEVK